MVSGLRAASYEEKLAELGLTTLEERRVHLDMLQTYKILNGKDQVTKDTWFRMARDGQRATRQTADPLNIRPGVARLEVRRNFFSQRVAEQWNKIPTGVKSAVSVVAFKNGYKKYRSCMQAQP